MAGMTASIATTTENDIQVQSPEPWQEIYDYSLDRLRELPRVLDEIRIGPTGLHVVVYMLPLEGSSRIQIKFELMGRQEADPAEMEAGRRAWYAARPAALVHLEQLSESWLPVMHARMMRDLEDLRSKTKLSVEQARGIVYEVLAEQMIARVFRRLEDGMRDGTGGKN